MQKSDCRSQNEKPQIRIPHSAIVRLLSARFGLFEFVLEFFLLALADVERLCGLPLASNQPAEPLVFVHNFSQIGLILDVLCAKADDLDGEHDSAVARGETEQL